MSITGSIKTQLGLIVAVLALGLVLCGAGAIYGIQTLATAGANTLDRLAVATSGLDAARSAQHHFKIQVQEWKNTLIRGSDKATFDKYWDAFSKEEQAVQDQLAKVQAAADKLGVTSLDSRQVADQLKQLGTKYREAIKSYDPSKASAAQEVDRLVRGIDRGPDQALDDLTEAGRRVMIESEAQAEDFAATRISFVRNMLTVAIALVLIVGVGVAVWLARRMSRTVSAVERTMLQVRATGDLSLRADIVAQDELGRIAESFNGMMDNFQDIIRRVREAASDVSGASKQINEAARALDQSSAKQSNAISSSAASVEELTVAITSVSQTAVEVRGTANGSLTTMSAGSERISDLTDEMQAIQHQVSAIAESVTHFIQSMTAIAGVTQKVKDLADQTNLLALNAAIEAARAGEQGRGFAVVADEVRKLAEKSGESAKHIEQMTKDFEVQSTEASNAIEAGLKSIDASVALARQVEDALKAAKDAAAEATRGVDHISLSVQEQQVASTHVAQSMERIAQMADEASTTSRDTSQAAAHLLGVAESLQSSVGRFRV